MEINAFGKPCPMPLVLAKKELDAGCEEIDIAVDNETAVENLMRLATTHKLAVSTKAIDGGYLVSLSVQREDKKGAQPYTGKESVPSEVAVSTEKAKGVRGEVSTEKAKGARGEVSTEKASSVTSLADKEEKALLQNSTGYAVFVGKDHVGEGDFELGYNLMKMALYTLSESEEVPAALLFMNSGVKLVCGDEKQVIDNVSTLIKRGTEVLVCGTCLDFYGIKGKLQIGVVSNMYDILGRMQEAGKVITL